MLLFCLGEGKIRLQDQAWAPNGVTQLGLSHLEEHQAMCMYHIEHL